MAVWFEPGFRWHTPFAVALPNHASRNRIMQCLALPGLETATLSVNGILWDGSARFFVNGDVIQVRSTSMRLGTLPVHVLSDRITGLAALQISCYGPARLRDVHLSIPDRLSHIAHHFQEWLRPLLLYAPSSHFNSIYLLVQGGPFLLVSLHTRLPPKTSEVQAFFDDVLLPLHGPRSVADLCFAWDDRCIYVARARDLGSELWFLLGGPALDAIELRFDEVLTRWPAPNGQLWFPGESSSNVGVAFLQDEATASDPPGPSRLPPLEDIPDACAFTVHTLRSIFGTSSEPSERSSLDLEELDVTEASPSMASSPLDSDGSSMLQTAQNMQGPKRITAGACRSTLLPRGIPTPCRNWKLPPCVPVAGSGLSEPPERVISLHSPATLNHAASSAPAEYSDNSSPANLSYGTAASSPAIATISSDKGVLAAAALPTYPISLELAFRNPSLAGQLAHAAVTLNSVITCPAFPLSFCHPLHGLHPAASDWIANATWISWAEAALDAAEVFVYTDGSSACGKGAWAFVVFSWHWAKGWCFHGSCAGLNSQCLFGEHSQHAFVAEASAMCAALSWALTLQPGAILHLSYDCLSAGKAATGEWRIPRAEAGPSQPHANARCLFLLLQSRGICVVFEHVHSHQGNPGNELADAVAGSAARDGRPVTGHNQAWVDLLATDLRDWIWHLPYTSWSWTLPSLPNLLSGQAAADVCPTPPSSCLKQLPTARPRTLKHTFEVSLDVGTFNANTLRAPGLLDLLQVQMSSQAISVLGVQEARLPSTEVFQTATHFVITSSSDDTGSFGCALLLDRTRPYATRDGVPIFWQRKHLFVVHADPRLLICRVHAPALQALFVVAHAPHSKIPRPERQLWWDNLDSCISHALKPNDLLWLLVDANGRVGKEVHQACGHFGAEEHNDNGNALLALADTFDLYLPSTFPGHTGHAATWRSPSGFEARIDYVACPRSMSHAVSGSRTGTIDLCAPRLDHRFSALHLAFGPFTVSTSVSFLEICGSS